MTEPSDMPGRLSITRRDFLGGTALLVAAGLTPLAQLRADEAENYPPALTGLRGSHPGAFEAAHALAREGKSFDASSLPVEESYDLIIVGGGISGLAAASFYRQKKGDQARILILENHDDFGGHAKRNEFTTPDGKLLIGYGGSESLEAPMANFSEAVWGLLEGLGVDLPRFDTAFDQGLYPGLNLTSGVFFNAEDFGTDRLVAGDPTGFGPDPMPGKVAPTRSLADFVAAFPLSDQARAELLALFNADTDPLAGQSDDEKYAYLETTSYRDYLSRDCGLGEEALRYFDGMTHDYFAIGPDGIPAAWAMESSYPGFAGLGLGEEDGEEEPYIYHFPDGNAGLVRLLVRSLIPGAIPGSTMDDIVLARADYARLDLPDSPVRLRLNSTVVHVANAAGGVDIAYVRDAALHRVAAADTVLACYNMIIPHLMPELPEDQKAALSANVKAPLVYANVVIRDWQAIASLGVSEVYCPRAFFPVVKLDYPVALGGYQNPRTPDEPMILHLVHVPTSPGLAQNDQFRAGRATLLETTFEAFEAEIIDQLQRMFGPGGFEASRDILAITVNRWPHGYAGVANPLFDDESVSEFVEQARQPKGRVTIANSDAGWNAFAHEAIDQAFRAVEELTTV